MVNLSSDIALFDKVYRVWATTTSMLTILLSCIFAVVAEPETVT